ncbi:hypothetical protein [Oribacterium sp. oral taxon 108]|uniref:hypothetical protein n=1 Tax=Oribacterium sp. oral taxon 108 TaxID=712414 RepID=UPI00020DD327|nr:hypothetical protein [Oribacterium sp. oral taxon 108]EGL36947.1 hypothetical protein HMPREF9124_0032 [Oribacterium sp. oral taxon 108 str. F0425]
MTTTKLWNRNFSLLILATTLGIAGGIAGGFVFFVYQSYSVMDMRLFRLPL